MKQKILWRLIGLVVGVGIVATSLLMARDVNSESEQSISHKQLHFGDQILPNNTIYPALMAVDRIKLISATKTERLVLMIKYSQRRLGSACQLVEESQPDLAVTTLLKSHHYLMQAVDLAIETRQIHQAPVLISELNYFLEICDDLKAKLQLADKSVFEAIAAQNTSAESRLQQLLLTEH